VQGLGLHVGNEMETNEETKCNEDNIVSSNFFVYFDTIESDLYVYAVTII
jgi:hypothetical protein